MSKIALTVVVCFIGIGLGFSVWLGFFKDSHLWERDLSQERRGAEWVGQNPELPPSKPINFEIHNHGCLRVDRANVDGDILTFELTRICGSSGDYAKLTWRAKAGNVVLASGMANYEVDGAGIGEQQIYEINNQFEYKSDPRTTDIIVTTSN